MKTVDVTLDGGKTYILGKADWPCALNVIMPRYYAWRMVESLLNQLKDLTNTNPELRFECMGNVEEIKEE